MNEPKGPEAIAFLSWDPAFPWYQERQVVGRPRRVSIPVPYDPSAMVEAQASHLPPAPLGRRATYELVTIESPVLEDKLLLYVQSGYESGSAVQLLREVRARRHRDAESREYLAKLPGRLLSVAALMSSSEHTKDDVLEAIRRIAKSLVRAFQAYDLAPESEHVCTEPKPEADKP